MRPTDAMDELADRTSAIENRTGREIADDWVNELVYTAQRDPDRLAAPPKPRFDVRAVRFTLTSDPLANPGRIADLTFVLDPEGVVDFAVLDYSESSSEVRAQRVLTGADAVTLWTVLDSHHKTAATPDSTPDSTPDAVSGTEPDADPDEPPLHENVVTWQVAARTIPGNWDATVSETTVAEDGDTKATVFVYVSPIDGAVIAQIDTSSRDAVHVRVGINDSDTPAFNEPVIP